MLIAVQWSLLSSSSLACSDHTSHSPSLPTPSSPELLGNFYPLPCLAPRADCCKEIYFPFCKFLQKTLSLSTHYPDLTDRRLTVIHYCPHGTLHKAQEHRENRSHVLCVVVSLIRGLLSRNLITCHNSTQSVTRQCKSVRSFAENLSCLRVSIRWLLWSFSLRHRKPKVRMPLWTLNEQILL